MAEIVNVRVDYRMVHGVICTLWCPTLGVNKIILVEDSVAKDAFLTAVYKSAVPSNIKFEAISMEGLISGWNENQLGEGKILLVFKTFDKAIEAYNKGFKFPAMYLGTVAPTEERVQLIAHVSLAKTEYQELSEFSKNNNVNILLQFTPQIPSVELESAAQGKFK